MPKTILKTDVIIIGGGIAGIAAAIDLLDANKTVIIFDRDKEENFGGLAKESFGGMFYINSPQQKRSGIKDSVALAKSDWYSFAEFSPDEYWGRKWADLYLESTEKVYQWVTSKAVKYFPVVHWVERGLFQPGNSVPRFHMVWGTGHGLMESLINLLKNHHNNKNLQLFFEHKVENLIEKNNSIIGVSGIDEKNNFSFEAFAEATIIATGGINGNMQKVRKHWHPDWNKPPQNILNGSHHFSDGLIHDEAEKHGAVISNLQNMWNYAAGITHPFPRRENHGLSLVPPKSALWLDSTGKRFGPMPLMTAYDTRFLVSTICNSDDQYSWQVLNHKIALKELAVSGSEFNDAIKNKNLFQFLLTVLFGNKKFIKALEEHSSDYIIANSVEELAEKMNALIGGKKINIENLKNSIGDYDNNIRRGKKLYNDEQLRRITHVRQYRGDKVRTCNFQMIDDKKAYPLVAIREFILSRKSLGGIQTNLHSQVLKQNNNNDESLTIKGLYAIGEAAGFGGGGSHGKRALEGTFLATCIFTAQKAVQHIIDKK